MWSKQLLIILKSQQSQSTTIKAGKKNQKNEENEDLLITSVGHQSGIIKETRSFDNFESAPGRPATPFRSSSRSRAEYKSQEFLNAQQQQQQQQPIQNGGQQQQIWLSAIPMPIMFANTNPGQIIMTNTAGKLLFSEKRARNSWQYKQRRTRNN